MRKNTTQTHESLRRREIRQLQREQEEDDRTVCLHDGMRCTLELVRAQLVGTLVAPPKTFRPRAKGFAPVWIVLLALREAKNSEAALRLQRLQGELEDPELRPEDCGYRTATVQQEIQRLEQELRDLRMEFISRMADASADRAHVNKMRFEKTASPAHNPSGHHYRTS